MFGGDSSALSVSRNARRGARESSSHWMTSSLARSDSASARFKVNNLLRFSSDIPLEAPNRSLLLIQQLIQNRHKPFLVLPPPKANEDKPKVVHSRLGRAEQTAGFGTLVAARQGAR